MRVFFAILFLCGLSALSIAQESQVPTTDQSELAALVAALADYGTEAGDALSLLTAAHLMRELDSPIVDRNSTIPEPNSEGIFDSNSLTFYDSYELISRAQDVADQSLDLQRIVDQLEEENLIAEPQDVGYCTTVYVWRCDYYGCRYRYVTSCRY